MRALPGVGATTLAVIALMFVSGLALQAQSAPTHAQTLPAGVASSQPSSRLTAPAHETSLSPRALFGAHPLAALPNASFFSGVGAITVDPKVANNSGINTTITLPAAFSPPSKGCVAISLSGFSGDVCAFLGIEEPFNSTASAGIGCIIATALGQAFCLPVGLLPNGSFIYSATNRLPLGATHTFSITHLIGKWWTFELDGAPITGNGTYNLNATQALGFSQSGISNPVQIMAEFGNTSFKMPQINVPWAIGIELNGTTSPSYQPVDGNALLLNASYPIGIQGHDQVASLPKDSVQEGDSITYPGLLAPLWGHFNPFGVMDPQAAAYTSEPAVAGNQGMEFTVTVPTVTEPKGTAEFLGVQMPVNSTLEIGVGVVFASTFAVPYYLVRNLVNYHVYTAKSVSIAPGSALHLATQAKGGGWWNFTENGLLIVNATTGSGNGTANLGVNTAAGFVGSTYAPNSSYFAESTFPMLGLFGNGTMPLINATAGMQFLVSGRGWMMPDYAYGYSWNSSVGIRSALPTPSGLSRGDVNLGSSVPILTTTPPLLWKGKLWFTGAGAAPATVVPGQTSRVSVNLTSQLASPSPGNVCATVSSLPPGNGCAMLFTPQNTTGNSTLYTASFTAPSLTSLTPLTVTFSILSSPSQPYEAASASTTLQVVPPTLVVQVGASSTTVTAGTTSTLRIWVNDSMGPVAGASVNVTPTVPGLGATATATSTVGLYTDTFTPPVTLANQTVYPVTFSANKTATVGGTATLTLTAVPLPLLVVQLSWAQIPGGISGGTTVVFTATVTSGGQAESGASVAVVINPSGPSIPSWSGVLSGVTGTSGTLELALQAPNVTTTTTFHLNATATLSGYRAATGGTQVTVKAPSATTSGSGGLGIYLYVIIGVVAAVAVVAVLLLVMRKKKGTPVSPARDDYAPAAAQEEDPNASPAPWQEQSPQP